jgi:hypothetical protein
MAEKCRSLGLEELDLTKAPGELNVATLGGEALSSTLVGNIACVVGVPQINGTFHYQGTVGEDLDIDDGRRAAGLAALSTLVELKHLLGDLDRIERMLVMIVFIASKVGFTQQPQVANGASEMMRELLGDKGQHVRAALGVVGMAGGQSVEIVASFAVK